MLKMHIIAMETGNEPHAVRAAAELWGVFVTMTWVGKTTDARWRKQNRGLPEAEAPKPIPDGVVVLTFDDGNRSDYSYVGPLLKSYGFGATFFLTEGLGFLDNKAHYVTWEEVRALHEDGFEIGNHTRHHKNVNTQSQEELLADLIHIDERCREHGIPVPETFGYPGDSHGRDSVEAVMGKGFRFARREVGPEFGYNLEGRRSQALRSLRRFVRALNFPARISNPTELTLPLQ